MTELLIVGGLFVAVAWLLSRTALVLVRIDELDEIPSGPFDPITSYVSDNYGQHFQDEGKSVTELLRKL